MLLKLVSVIAPKSLNHSAFVYSQKNRFCSQMKSLIKEYLRDNYLPTRMSYFFKTFFLNGFKSSPEAMFTNFRERGEGGWGEEH